MKYNKAIKKVNTREIIKKQEGKANAKQLRSFERIAKELTNNRNSELSAIESKTISVSEREIQIQKCINKYDTWQTMICNIMVSNGLSREKANIIFC